MKKLWTIGGNMSMANELWHRYLLKEGFCDKPSLASTIKTHLKNV
jgi:hypothetical protein